LRKIEKRGEAVNISQKGKARDELSWQKENERDLHGAREEVEGKKGKGISD